MVTTTKRIYVVANTTTGEKHLVEATHPSVAIRMIVDDSYEATVPHNTELAELLESGIRIKRAAVDQALSAA